MMAAFTCSEQLFKNTVAADKQSKQVVQIHPLPLLMNPEMIPQWAEDVSVIGSQSWANPRKKNNINNNNNKQVKSIWMAEFHHKAIAHGRLSVVWSSAARYPRGYKWAQSRHAICPLLLLQQNSRSVPCTHYSWSQHTAEKDHTAPPSAERPPRKTKIKEEMRRRWRVECVCLGLRACLSWPTFLFLFLFFCLLPKHVFDICMLEWLYLLPWWKFLKCHAMFQRLSSMVCGLTWAVQPTGRSLMFQSAARAERRAGQRWLNVSLRKML